MRILLIRPGALGDSLLTFPVMQALRSQQKDVRITFVSNPAVLPLARASHLADEVFDYGHPLWSELFLPPAKQSQQFRSILHQFDKAVCWIRDDEHLIEHGLCAAAIKQVHVAPGRPAEGERIHIVDYLLRTIGMQHTPVEATFMTPSVPNRFAWSDRIAPECQGDGRHECRPYEHAPVAIHPGSGGARKCWPVSSFITIIEALLQRSIPVLLLGGPADHERIQAIQQRVMVTAKDSAPFTTLIDASWLEGAEQLQQSRGHLGKDAGITHLAALSGIPTLALFGPSDPAIWHPIGLRVHLLYEPDLPCLLPDTVMQVLEAFILQGRTRA